MMMCVHVLRIGMDWTAAYGLVLVIFVAMAVEDLSRVTVLRALIMQVLM